MVVMFTDEYCKKNDKPKGKWPKWEEIERERGKGEITSGSLYMLGLNWAFDKPAVKNPTAG